MGIMLGALSISKIYGSSILIQCWDFCESLSHLKGHGLTGGLTALSNSCFHGQKKVKAIAPTLCALMGSSMAHHANQSFSHARVLMLNWHDIAEKMTFSSMHDC
jgi:hypothetical protein